QESTLTALSDGRLVTLYSTYSNDLTRVASNANEYAHFPFYPVAPLGPLATPKKGYKLRIYNINQHRSTNPRMRILRSQNLMLNIMMPRTEPRDVSALSPHYH